MLKRNGEWRGELQHCTKAGRQGRRCHPSPACTRGGREERVLEINRDITEQRRATDALNAANAELEEKAERLRIALAAGRMGTFDWHIVANEVTLDDTLCELMGFDPEGGSVPPERFLERIHPDDLLKADGSYRRGFDGT